MRDHGELGIELAGKGEQVVALVLKRDSHRADASWVLRLAGGEFGDEEVEQLAPGRQVWAGKHQDVVAQPVQERAHVACEPACLGFGLSRPVQLGGKVAVRGTLTRAADPGLQRLAPRRDPLGETSQRIGQALALAHDVEHVAMTGRFTPGRPLPGAQALSRIGDGVVGPQPLRSGIEQVHAPGVRVAALCGGQEIAIRGPGIDAGQHRCGAVEELVMQADANAR